MTVRRFRLRLKGRQGICRLLLLSLGTLLGGWPFPAVAQAPQPPSEDDPAMARILLWQLDRGETAKAEKLLRANLPQVETRLEEMIQEIDRERDIVGRFGAVSIWFGPGYGEIDAKVQHYEKLFDFYRHISGKDDLYNRFEVGKLRVEGSHYTNQGETTCGTNLDWDGAQKLYRQAIDSLEKAFLIVQKQNDFRMMASIKDNIGSTQIRLLHPQEALQAYTEGVKYADQLEGDLYKGLLRLNLANVYVWIGEPERALPYAQEAMNIFRKIGRGTWEANAMMTMGNAYLRQQKFSTAWETLNLTLQKAQQSGEYRVYGRTLLNLGMAGLLLKRPDSRSLLEQGLEWYKQDNEIYPAIEREAVLQDGLRALSQLSQQAGNQSQAEQYTKQYLEMLGSDPNRYQTLRQSPCFAIYTARPVPEKLSSR